MPVTFVTGNFVSDIILSSSSFGVEEVLKVPLARLAASLGLSVEVQEDQQVDEQRVEVHLRQQGEGGGHFSALPLED
jgi:hypothetical protein